jgi:hypothetical protein
MIDFVIPAAQSISMVKVADSSPGHHLGEDLHPGASKYSQQGLEREKLLPIFERVFD